MIKLISNFEILVFLILILSLQILNAQHRGDNLAFQGIGYVNDYGVKSLAMGNAYNSISGDINSLFWNRAGLADLKSFQFSLSARSFSRSWKENQVYRPNRFFVTLPFYLEGLYTPDPANNGVWDYELAGDSSYIVNYPAMGLDPYSDEAADWKKKESDFALNNLAAAFPFNISGQQFVVAASYHRIDQVLDYDRNDTYLDPHLGYSEYNMPARVDGTDTIAVNWSRFERVRSGKMSEVVIGAAYDLSEKIKIGLGMNITSGETEDLQVLDRVGYFELYQENRFRFSYDTVATRISGISKFNASRFNLGAIYKLNKFSLGATIYLPYTYTRDWNYDTEIMDSTGSSVSVQSGKDKFKMSAAFALGTSFTPIKQFIFSLDYEFIPYSNARFELASNDTTHRDWADVQILRFGIEFMPYEIISFLAGYQNIPQTFVPDGAAFRDKGPNSQSFTMGASLSLRKLGRIDLAYEIRRLKYYDSYYSNTNYVEEKFNRFMLGYVFSL